MKKELWEMYKRDSQKGKKTIKAFNPNVEDIFAGIDTIADFESTKWHSYNYAENAKDYFNLVFINFGVFESSNSDKELTRELYENFIDKFELKDIIVDSEGIGHIKEDGKVIVRKDNYREKAAATRLLSLYLYYNYDFFKPMLLPTRFDIIQRNCDLLGIELPDLPRTKKYKDYCMYYYDICQCWNEFQQENDMTDAEFCACLYDFADMLAEEKQESELPEPTNVWLTGASGKGDFEFVDALGTDDTYNKEHVWACNERTRRGDIVVMYCLSPRSYIHSIWRANSGGIFNPFDNYHCRTTVCDGIRVPDITFNDLKGDDYFKEVPIVRKNLQGINGWELTAKDYNELQRIIEQKGGDISTLPKLFNGGDIDFGKLEKEKNVEEQILIPALRDLGYKDTDWTRQLSLKAGRKEKAIPDFVFFPTGQEHFETAPMVIEAKLDMSSVTEQNKAFKQAFSYLKMLRSKLMAICDKERIVVYRADANGAVDKSNPMFENHWKAIFADSVIGANLKKIIGAEVVKTLS